MRPRVKICCISSRDEARLAMELGASALGLVSSMPSGPGVISEREIHEIARTIPPGVSSFLLTCLQDPEEIVAQHRRCRTSTIQICDALPDHAWNQIREELPGIGIVQVVHVRDESSVDEALRAAPHVDAILLDSGNQSLAVKELGGTGRVHDWSISRTIVNEVPVPVYLAGGLTAHNVAEAIETVRPFGLDLCSGVRRDGRLDRERLETFMASVASLA